jgi:hypothetical protein
MAAERLGLTEAPVVIADHLTDEEKRAYVLADNKLAELGVWDDELLKIELGDLTAIGFDLAVTGFSDKELEWFFPSEALEGEDECVVPVKAATQPGDIWGDRTTPVSCAATAATSRAETSGNGHAAPYPVALPIVYDPFMGSGMTMVAAHKHGRIGIGTAVIHEAGGKSSTTWR